MKIAQGLNQIEVIYSFGEHAAGVILRGITFAPSSPSPSSPSSPLPCCGCPMAELHIGDPSSAPLALLDRCSRPQTPYFHANHPANPLLLHRCLIDLDSYGTLKKILNVVLSAR